MIQRAVQRILDGAELTQEEIAESVREIAEGRATQAQMGAFLVAFRQKGETPGEIAAFASALEEYSIRIQPRVKGRLIDTCGTGGDRVKTLNVSTISAFVASGAGVAVAKHGGRSVTSRCGSADLLERLGFDLNVAPAVVEEAIERIGVGFMFAPSFHPAMKHVGPIRKELGVRTIFNLVGPLINPAKVKAQVVGVYAPELVDKVANVLRLLGSVEVMVVHAVEGMDEISVSGKTLVAWLREGEVRTLEFSPDDFGLTKRQQVRGEVGGVEDGAKIAFDILDGRLAKSPLTDMVVANSAAALVVAGKADSLAEGVEQARESIASGAAIAKLTALVKSSGGDASRIEVYAKSG